GAGEARAPVPVSSDVPVLPPAGGPARRAYGLFPLAARAVRASANESELLPHRPRAAVSRGIEPASCTTHWSGQATRTSSLPQWRTVRAGPPRAPLPQARPPAGHHERSVRRAARPVPLRYA